MAIDYASLKKNGFLKQKQKGMFSLRLQIVGGHVTAENLIKIYEVAEKYGKGYVHLTSRQSVEIPYIKYEDIEEVKEELAKGGCKTAAIGPRVRTVTACQGNTLCSSGNVDAYHIAVELDKRYYGKDLPHKFKFGVTGCQNNCLKAEENDLGIKGAMEVYWKEDNCIFCGACQKACRAGAIKMEDNTLTLDKEMCTNCGRCEKACPKNAITGEIAYIVSFGGLFGNTIHRGDAFLPLIKSEEQLFRITDEALKFFRDNGKSGERFKYTIDRIGVDQFKKVMKDAFYNNNM